MKVYKFAKPYQTGKNGAQRTTFPETRNHAGVYIIKEDGKIVYVGFSSYSVYKTMYRHFQEWNHKYQEVVSYANRLHTHTYTVRPILCTDKQAYALEKRLIRKYHPRDNTIQYEAMLQEQDATANAYAAKVEQTYFDAAKQAVSFSDDDAPF